MRINVAVPEASVSAPVLDAALESVTRLNEQLLADGAVPTFDKALKKGIVWKPEPPGEEHFDHAGVVVRRGWGDCDDLAPYEAATLRHTGEDPDAKAIVRRSGPKRWHAIVQHGDGSLRDPSKAAGMGAPVGVLGATLPLMHALPPEGVGAYIIRPGIAMRPVRGQWQSRTDMPWNWKEHLWDKPRPTDYAMTTLHIDPVASTSLVGAIEGALKLAMCGGYAHPENINRLAAIADYIEGVDMQDIAACYGEDHAIAAEAICGSFFGKLKKVAKGAAKGAFKMATAPQRFALSQASSVVKHIPGVGPIAAKTLDTANRAMAGDPKAMLQLAKDPALRKLVQFVPGVGPIASSALEIANKVFPIAETALVHPAELAKFAAHPESFPVVDDSVDLSSVVVPERFL
jgi:hypothetical protein